MVERDEDGQPTASEAVEGAGSGPDAAPDQRAGKTVTDVHSYIGRQLRAVYDDIAKQPIPDRFVALMQELEAKSTG